MRMAPASSVSVASAGSADSGIRPFAATNGVSAPRTSRPVVLVGPVATCALRPRAAASVPATAAVVSPYAGGIPASIAYAIACGRATSATVSPA